MLPDLRFVIGAAVAISLLGMTGLGLFATVRLAHHAKMGPLETSRSLAFADHAEWNPFYDPDSARLFDGMARKPDRAQPAAQEPAIIAEPVVPSPLVKAAAPDDAAGRIAAPVAEAAEPRTAMPAPPIDPAISASAAAARITVPDEATATPPAKPEWPAVVAAPPPTEPTGASEPTATAAGAGAPAAVVTVPIVAAGRDQEPPDIGAIAAAAGGAPPIASAPPTGGIVHAPPALSEPALYAKIQEMVWAPARPAAVAPAVPKVQAKPKVRASVRHAVRNATLARPRVHAAPRYRSPQQRVGEYGPYYFGTNPWAQAR